MRLTGARYKYIVLIYGERSSQSKIKGKLNYSLLLYRRICQFPYYEGIYASPSAMPVNCHCAANSIPHTHHNSLCQCPSRPLFSWQIQLDQDIWATQADPEECPLYDPVLRPDCIRHAMMDHPKPRVEVDQTAFRLQNTFRREAKLDFVQERLSPPFQCKTKNHARGDSSRKALLCSVMVR